VPAHEGPGTGAASLVAYGHEQGIGKRVVEESASAHTLALAEKMPIRHISLLKPVEIPNSGDTVQIAQHQ
jgi:hypothetical protein